MNAPVSAFHATQDEAHAWASFAAPADEAAFLGGWLGIVCNQIQQVRGGLLLMRQGPELRFGAAAVWPDPQRDLHYLAPAAEKALKEQRGLVLTDTPGSAHVAYPVELEGALHGAVVLDLPALPPLDLQRALRLLHWASAWLLERLRSQAQQLESHKAQRAVLVNQLLVGTLQAPTLAEAALALADALAHHLGCERVSLGLAQEGSTRLLAISHTATFDPRSQLARQLAEAMDEVLDLGVLLAHPADAQDETGAMAQAALAREARREAVCTVPVMDAGQCIGAIALEREHQVFDGSQRELLRQVGVLVGPVLRMRQLAERRWWRRGLDGLHLARQALFGPGHPGAKLLAVSAVVLLVAAAWQVPARVAARAVVEGEVRRAAVAPFDGVLEAAWVHPGERVRQGQLLASMQERELRLEQARLSSELEMADRKLRQAGALQDRAAMVMAQAQAAQAQAQAQLVDARLARARITAPVDALVAEGELSGLIGAPVQQGKVLFELVPLQGWRLALQVDERDISRVQPGQTGQLVLTGTPGQKLPLEVERITPLAQTQEGRNGFRVEARLVVPPVQAAALATLLRPGMEGVAKLETGEEAWIWVWTRHLVEALELALWRFTP